MSLEIDKSLVRLKNQTYIPKALANSIINRDEDVLISNPKNFFDVFSGSNLIFIFKLAAYLHEEQIYNKKQLEVFDNNWMSLDSESEGHKTFIFKYSNFISSSNNADFKKNLKILSQTFTEIKTFIIDAEGERQDIELNSTIISDLIFIKNKGFKFKMNFHWLRKFIDISGHYRGITTEAVFRIKYKHTLVFYLWICSLKELKTFRLESDKVEFQSLAGDNKERILATRCRIELLNTLFGVNCDKPSKMIVILKKIKAEMDQYCDRSFNYSYNTLTQRMSIVSYELNNSLQLKTSEKSIDPFEIDSIKIRKAVNYRIKKQNLSAKEALRLLMIYLKYSFEIVSKATSNKEVELYLIGGKYIVPTNNEIKDTGKVSLEKKKVADLEGELFVDVVTLLCDNYCSKNNVIVELRTYNQSRLKKELIEDYLNKAQD